MSARLNTAIEARKRGHYAAALRMLEALGLERPKDPLVAYHHAWTLDNLGREKAAIAKYQRAIALGLTGERLRDCYLGLGSSLRCAGQFKESSRVLRLAARRYPRYAPLRVFLSLTYFAAGEQRKAFRLLGRTLLEESRNPELILYRRALSAYFNEI